MARSEEDFSPQLKGSTLVIQAILYHCHLLITAGMRQNGLRKRQVSSSTITAVITLDLSPMDAKCDD